MTETFFANDRATGVTGSGITANSSELNRIYGPQPPLPTRAPSLLGQAWNALTGRLDDSAYELQMPWNLPTAPAPVYVNVGNDEAVMLDPGVAALEARAAQARALVEPLMEVDDMPDRSTLSQEEIDAFGDRVEAFGRDKFLTAIRTCPKTEVVTNAAQAKAYSDVMLFVNAAGDMDRLEQLIGAWVEQQNNPGTRMPLADTVARVRLIEAIAVNSVQVGGPIRTVAELRTIPTDTLQIIDKIYNDRLPRDYSANAGAYRVNGPEEEELKMPWPKVGDATPYQWQATESPNNWARRMAANANGNGNGTNGNGHK